MKVFVLYLYENVNVDLGFFLQIFFLQVVQLSFFMVIVILLIRIVSLFDSIFLLLYGGWLVDVCDVVVLDLKLNLFSCSFVVVRCLIVFSKDV